MILYIYIDMNTIHILKRHEFKDYHKMLKLRKYNNFRKLNAAACQARTMLIYLLATGLPFFPRQKLQFPREYLPLSSSYFITGVRL